jgi:hypothetical protein
VLLATENGQRHPTNTFGAWADISTQTWTTGESYGTLKAFLYCILQKLHKNRSQFLCLLDEETETQKGILVPKVRLWLQIWTQSGSLNLVASKMSPLPCTFWASTTYLSKWLCFLWQQMLLDVCLCVTVFPLLEGNPLGQGHIDCLLAPTRLTWAPASSVDFFSP